MKVCFETFGCRLNRAEALAEEAQYLARGWERTESHADAQLVVVRGCSVTARAQRDCEHLIDHIRRKYPTKRVIVTGCLPSADKGYFLKGVGSSRVNLGSSRVSLGSARVNVNSKSTLNDPNSTLKDPKSTLSDPNPTLKGPIPTRTARAYLKIQDGCASRCAFCIVPQFRGSSRSVAWDEVLDTSKRFIDAGYHEIVVTGCNLAQYNADGRRLPELVDALASLSPDCRIRLSSVEPGPVALDVVPAMAQHANVCRFLHIPVQTGSARILAAMRRPYSVHQVDELIHAATKAMPNLGLGCDMMTGFPDETDNDQLATLGFLRRHPFTKAHVFPYSERPGTVAAALPGVVPKPVRSARAHEIANLMDEKRTLYAKRFRGHDVEVVVEDEKSIAGWTSEYLWCRVGEEKPGAFAFGRNGRKLKRKDLVRIRVKESDGHMLTGDPV